LVSLLLSTAISALGGVLAGINPALTYAAHAINITVSFAIVTVLFAMIYKFLPNIELKWKDAMIGATFTSALFAIGKFLIGLYLGRASATSAYGAAGSVVILLLWVYYSAQILYLGAEFTKVYARSHASPSELGAEPPRAGAVPPKKPASRPDGPRGFDGRQRLV
jgi:membrane protein